VASGRCAGGTVLVLNGQSKSLLQMKNRKEHQSFP
jgi:hypothetical protein